MSDLRSSCLAAWDQTIRTTEAFHGGSRSRSFPDAVRHDVLQILSVFTVANGDVTRDLGRLYQAVSRSWHSKRHTVKDCIYEIGVFEREGICLPATVQVLHISDQLLGNCLASCVAEAYKSLVIAAAECCGASFAVTAVQTEYDRLLEPYLPRENWHASSQPDDERRQGSPDTGTAVICPHCRDAYGLLELPLSAGPEAVTLQD
jgi:hypothetical protein